MKVEDPDDIQNVAAITGNGSEVREDNSARQDVASQDSQSQSSAVNVDSSVLPSHLVLDMPALSPTMVRTYDDHG